MNLDPANLNERAEKLGYAVVQEELVGHPANMGRGAWCRVERDGERVFGQSWRAEEVDLWLRMKEAA